MGAGSHGSMLDCSRFCPLVVLLVGCGGPARPASPEVRSTPPVAAVTDVDAGANDEVLPTALGDAALRRDAELVPLATALVDAYPNWIGWYSTLVASWSPDGSQMLFGSLRDGSPQIYAADPSQPASAARPITSGPERAVWASHTADGRHIVFLRDRGGDERFGVWRVGVDGSGLVELTPEPQFRGPPSLPRGRPDVMVYSAPSLVDASTQVYVQPIAGGAPTRVHTHPGLGWLGEAAPDGQRALFVEFSSTDELAVVELDFATRSAKRVFPAPGRRVNVFSAVYSHDGRRVIVTTDEGGEASTVVALDPSSGAQTARYASPGPAGASLVALVSPTGEHVVVYVDAGNHGELRVLDARTLALVREVEVPLGDLKLGAFRADGREFSVMMSLPDRPPDVYAVDPRSGAVRPLRDDARPGLAGLAKVAATIASAPAHDGLKIPINVYLPAEAGAQRRPTVVIFHGGPAWSVAVRWDLYMRFLVALGYAVVEPNVRGSTGFGRAYEMADNREKRADWLRDLATVNAWVKAQPWCDGGRVAVWGESYGGYTTLMALTRQPEDWRVGVDLYGIADLETFLRTTGPMIGSGLAAEFGDPERDAALLAEFSPMRDVARISAPLFVYTGQNDPRVPRSESDSIVRALRRRGVPVEYMVADDEGHAVDHRHNKIELLTRTARFLADAMR